MTYGIIELAAGWFHVKSDPHVRMKVMRLFPAARDVSGVLRLKENSAACEDLLWVLDRFPHEARPGLMQYLRAQVRANKDNREAAQNILDGLTTSPVPTALPLRDYQTTAVELTRRSPGLLIGDDVGLGKEQPISEPTPTPQGWRHFGDLMRGDEVFNAAGEPVKILEVFPQGVKPVYRVTFTDGIATRCGLEHLWLTESPARRSPRVIPLSEIIQRGLVRKNGAPRFRIPRQKMTMMPDAPLPLDPYFVGVILGDGCTAPSMHGLQATIGHEDSDIIPRLPTPLSTRDASGCTQVAWNADMLRDFRAAGIDGYSTEKRIPPAFLNSGTNQRIALLRGMMDTDGSCSKNRAVFHSTNPELAQDVKVLIDSLGGYSTVRRYVRSDGKNDDYQVRVQTDFCPFLTGRKASQWKPGGYNKCHRRSIISVELCGEEECRCIKVPGGLYLTNHHIVTHNTATAIGVVVTHELPAVVVCPTHIQQQWCDQFQAFAPHLKTHIIKKRESYPLPAHHVTVLSYSKLDAWAERQPWKTVVFDEVHELRGDNTKKGHAAAFLAQVCKIRVGLSVGPHATLLLRGGPFGRGWLGTISEAWDVMKGIPSRKDGEYELIDAEACGVESRGWTGAGFGWKPVMKFIRHRCTKPVRDIQAGGTTLTVTEDHSVFHAGDGQLACAEGANLPKDAILLTDNGAQWDVQPEKEIDILEVSRKLDRLQVVVDTSGTNRRELGMSASDWQNCRAECTYGPRLPAQVYLRHRDILPDPTAIYLGRGKAPCLPAKVKLSEWAYVLGFFLGDGWATNDRVAFAVETARVGAFTQRIHTLGLGLRPIERKMPGESSEIRMSNRVLANLLQTIFQKKKCFDKFLPAEWITSWPETARRELLQGLVDSDGHTSERGTKRGSHYATTSERLAEGVRALLTSLGIPCGIHARKPADGGTIKGRKIIGKRTAFHVTWATRSEEAGIDSQQRRVKWSRGKFHEAPMRTNRPGIRPEWVYDLEMLGHPSFTANNLLVHNSATPIFNYAGEIWNVMQGIAPGALGTKDEFQREWKSDNKGRVADPVALGAWLRSQYVYLRRTRKEVGRELPPEERINHIVEHDPKIMERMEVLGKQLALKVLNGSFTEKGIAARELDARLRQITGLAKAPFVADFVAGLVANGEQVILAGWHRECFAAGTEIMMADGGIRKIESVLQGEKVMGPDSNQRKVKAAFRDHGKRWLIQPNRGQKWVCSDGHILTLRNTETKNTVTMTAGQFAALTPGRQRRFALYKSGALQFKKRPPVFEPWLLGYWLGDGNSSLHSVIVSTGDTEVSAELGRIAERYALTLTSQPCAISTKCRFFTLAGKNAGPKGTNRVLREFQGLNVKNNKHIPHAYKTASAEQRWELLAGLIDSDGHVYGGNAKGTMEFTNKNERLARDVAFVARSLGISATVTKEYKKTQLASQAATYCRVTMCGDFKNLTTRITRKKAVVRAGQKNVLHTGFKIEPAPDGDYFGIEVDGDNLFLLGDTTVVHNCYDVWAEVFDRAGVSYAFYTGKESTVKKGVSAAKFMAKECQVLILSLRSGEGLDGLQAVCSTVVFGELDWSPQRHHQLIGRARRDGMDVSKRVTAFFLMARSGTDPIVAQILGNKWKSATAVTDPSQLNSDADEFSQAETESRVAMLARDWLNQCKK